MQQKGLKEKKESASALIRLNRKLIKQEEWKQLDPGVDLEKITWNDEDKED